MSDGESVSDDRLLTTAEVAVMFRVSPTTVTRWAKAGRISAIQVAPAGDRRYRESEIHTLLRGEGHGDQR